MFFGHNFVFFFIENVVISFLQFLKKAYKDKRCYDCKEKTKSFEKIFHTAKFN